MLLAGTSDEANDMLMSWRLEEFALGTVDIIHAH